MSTMFRFLLTRCFVFWSVILFSSCPLFGREEHYDVVIYGGTSAAVTAAVQVKKMGKSVVMVSPDTHLGGLTSGGLGYTDSGRTGAIGGLSREFYQRVYAVYQSEKTWRWQKSSEYVNQGQGTRAMIHEDKTMWIFEPHVAESVFDSWVKEMEIPVLRDVWLDREKGVKKEGGRIVSISTLCGKVFTGKIFIDATYEGDLMAAAGVEYYVGREANSQYSETWNGNQVGKLPKGHLFEKPVDPYVVPGDPSSGRLRYIDDSKPGVRGEADHRVQAYCFRMCLTDHAPNRIPFPKPEGYDPEDYELLLRVFDTGWRRMFAKFDRIPNRKTDTNNHGPFSTDFIGMNYDYPEASYERRKEIIAEHERYQKGLMYFMANDHHVPEDVREAMSKWGLAKDEFLDNGNWPHQLYIREARRMIGEYVMTENDCLRKRQCPKPVGMGSYGLDSHNVRRYITPEGHVQNEGDIQESTGGAYTIDYGSITPKREQCTNLLVPICVSSSHISYGSIRMEPVFMILGQSAATAAVMSINGNISVQEVDYEKLRERLLADKQRLSYDNASHVGQGIAKNKLQGLVMDNNEAEAVGNWEEGRAIPKYVGNSYAHDSNKDKGKSSVTYTFPLEKPGKYEVRISYPPNPNRASNVPVLIRHQHGEKTVEVNQKNKPPIDDLFVSVGVYDFGEKATVVISNRETNGHVIVDAVQLLPASR